MIYYHDYVYWWADGIYLQARMEKSRDCILVIVGVLPNGKKEVVAISDGYRESKQSWLELLNDLKHRGLTTAPKIAVGDGALGFWAALSEGYSSTVQQHCWVHKTANILNKLPKSLHAAAKSDIHQISMAENSKEANKALDKFVAKYHAKYPKAAECLEKDRERLLAFYFFPAENWASLRTTNPIESTFATVRHRTYKAKGCFSRTTILTMVFKLLQSAETRWKKLYGFKHLADVIKGVDFKDGIKQTDGEFNGKEVAA